MKISHPYGHAQRSSEHMDITVAGSPGKTGVDGVR